MRKVARFAAGSGEQQSERCNQEDCARRLSSPPWLASPNATSQRVPHPPRFPPFRFLISCLLKLPETLLRSQPSLKALLNSLFARVGSEHRTGRIKRKGSRLGKTMIVALARKLLVALWKYATAGVLIEGALLKPA